MSDDIGPGNEAVVAAFGRRSKVKKAIPDVPSVGRNKLGGYLQSKGLWNDPGSGQFVRLGFSTQKAESVQQARDAADGIRQAVQTLQKTKVRVGTDKFKRSGVRKGDWVEIEFVDLKNGRIASSDGKKFLVDWDKFDAVSVPQTPAPVREIRRDLPPDWVTGAQFRPFTMPSEERIRTDLAFTLPSGYRTEVTGYSLNSDSADNKFNLRYSNGVTVEGAILAPDGQQAGTFRWVFLDYDRAESNALFDRMTVYPEYQSRGIGTQVLANQLDAVKKWGARKVTFEAISGYYDTSDPNPANGAYTWARSGADWDLSATNFEELGDRLAMNYAGEPGVDEMVTRLLSVEDSHTLGNSPVEAEIPEDFPTPNDVAMVGWTPGAEDWPGKRLLTQWGLAWQGQFDLRDTDEVLAELRAKNTMQAPPAPLSDNAMGVRDFAQASDGPVMARVIGNGLSRGGIKEGDIVAVTYVDDLNGKVKAETSGRSYNVKWSNFDSIEVPSEPVPDTAPKDVQALLDEFGVALPWEPPRALAAAEIVALAKWEYANQPDILSQIDAGQATIEIISGPEKLPKGQTDYDRQVLRVTPGLKLPSGDFLPVGMTSEKGMRTQAFMIGTGVTGPRWRDRTGRKWAGENVNVITGTADGIQIGEFDIASSDNSVKWDDPTKAAPSKNIPKSTVIETVEKDLTSPDWDNKLFPVGRERRGRNSWVDSQTGTHRLDMGTAGGQIFAVSTLNTGQRGGTKYPSSLSWSFREGYGTPVSGEIEGLEGESPEAFLARALNLAEAETQLYLDKTPSSTFVDTPLPDGVFGVSAMDNFYEWNFGLTAPSPDGFYASLTPEDQAVVDRVAGKSSYMTNPARLPPYGIDGRPAAMDPSATQRDVYLAVQAYFEARSGSLDANGDPFYLDQSADGPWMLSLMARELVSATLKAPASERDPDVMRFLQLVRKQYLDEMGDKYNSVRLFRSGDLIGPDGTEPNASGRRYGLSRQTGFDKPYSGLTSWAIRREDSEVWGAKWVTQDIPNDRVLGRFGTIPGEIVVAENPEIIAEIDNWVPSTGVVPSGTAKERALEILGNDPNLASASDPFSSDGFDEWAASADTIIKLTTWEVETRVGELSPLGAVSARFRSELQTGQQDADIPDLEKYMGPTYPVGTWVTVAPYDGPELAIKNNAFSTVPAVKLVTPDGNEYIVPTYLFDAVENDDGLERKIANSGGLSGSEREYNARDRERVQTIVAAGTILLEDMRAASEMPPVTTAASPEAVAEVDREIAVALQELSKEFSSFTPLGVVKALIADAEKYMSNRNSVYLSVDTNREDGTPIVNWDTSSNYGPQYVLSLINEEMSNPTDPERLLDLQRSLANTELDYAFTDNQGTKWRLVPRSRSYFDQRGVGVAGWELYRQEVDSAGVIKWRNQFFTATKNIAKDRREAKKITEAQKRIRDLYQKRAELTPIEPAELSAAKKTVSETMTWGVEKVVTPVLVSQKPTLPSLVRDRIDNEGFLPGSSYDTDTILPISVGERSGGNLMPWVLANSYFGPESIDSTMALIQSEDIDLVEGTVARSAARKSLVIALPDKTLPNGIRITDARYESIGSDLNGLPEVQVSAKIIYPSDDQVTGGMEPARPAFVVWKKTYTGGTAPDATEAANLIRQNAAALEIARQLGEAERIEKVKVWAREVLDTGQEPVFAKGKTSAIADKARVVIKDFVPKAMMETMPPVGIQMRASTRRAKYNFGDRLMLMGDKDPATLLHEFSHHIEHSDVGLTRAMWAYYQERTLGETPVRLPGYRSDEKFRPDKFFTAYAGKVYPYLSGYTEQRPIEGGSSEIFTMGMQGLFYPDINNREQDSRIDDEYAAYMLGLLLLKSKQDPSQYGDISGATTSGSGSSTTSSQLMSEPDTWLSNPAETPFHLFEVGGAVRDEILGVASNDVDFSVVAKNPDGTADEKFDEMVSFLEAEGFQIFQKNREYLTVRAKAPIGSRLAERSPVADFVLARSDGPSTDGRRPDWVKPGSLMEDLARRDFTWNAMAKRGDGTIVDPFGGQADLDARLLRFVGEPIDRIRDDGLRVMRAFRFAVTKDMTIEPKTFEALTSPEAAQMLSSVSRERIRDELEKMFSVDTVGALALLATLPDWTVEAMFPDGLRLTPTMKAGSPTPGVPPVAEGTVTVAEEVANGGAVPV